MRAIITLSVILTSTVLLNTNDLYAESIYINPINDHNNESQERILSVPERMTKDAEDQNEWMDNHQPTFQYSSNSRDYRNLKLALESKHAELEETKAALEAKHIELQNIISETEKKHIDLQTKLEAVQSEIRTKHAELENTKTKMKTNHNERQDTRSKIKKKQEVS